MKIIILLISAFVCLQANAAPAMVDFASKANVTGICTIQATDISFGTLASPLTAQSGSGREQLIPVNIKIVPDKSSSLYPAADFYMDTITTSIVY